MNEEIEYAEMLEIPVSTVNVVKKPHRRRKQKTIEEAAAPAPELPAPTQDTQSSPLKDSVIEKVNERLSDEPSLEASPAPLESEPLEGFEGRLDFDPIPERIDTVRVYSTEEAGAFAQARLYPQDYALDGENEGGRYASNEKNNRLAKGIRIALGAEFAAACVLCGAIFLTNVFMPNSAINTFFRSLASPSATAQADTRTYADFTLSPVVSELSDAELTLSPAGILSFTDACCVYPAANGKITDVSQDENGVYTVKLAHSDSFTEVFNGLDQVYYAVGDEVKANVPLGYSDGEEEVQVTMYSNGALLNCFQITEENCLAWVTETTAE